MLMNLRSWIMLSGLLAAASLPALGGWGDTFQTFQWEGRIEPGHTVEIKGLNGSVRAERAYGGAVEVIARRVGRNGLPTSVRVEVVEHDGDVTLCAVPGLFSNIPNACRPGVAGGMPVEDNDAQVEFTVLVPDGVRFVGRTVNGEIEAHSLRADVEAHSVNGRIRLSTTGTAQADTINGAIEATIGTACWTRPLSFSTVNGSIDLSLPSSASTALRASTINGSISTDFRLNLHGSSLGRNISGTIGAGGRSLLIRTVNGNVRLRRNTARMLY